MEIDGVEDLGLSVQVEFQPVETGYRRIEMSDSERMEEIGRLATALFTLLNQTQPPPFPPMMGVVVVKQTVVEEKEKEEEIVQDAAEPVVAKEIEEDSHLKISQMIEGYRAHIQRLLEAVNQERCQQKMDERIELLKQLNQTPFRIASKEYLDRMKRIDLLEKEIQLTQEKIGELQALHDNKG